MSQGQRRLAAIMFTDMVGYTALGQKNESLSLAMVEEQRRVVRLVLGRHNGREVKTIGDAFLVEFQSALDAVRCAYDIQRSVRDLNLSLPDDKRVHLRIGVHLGDVVESGGDITGDAVNVASRIESIAEDGGVCLTRQVFDHVQNKFEVSLSSMGAKSLKNVSAPLEIYRMEMPWDKQVTEAGSPLDPKRIAVLPFVSMSPQPDDEYFADGLTEELITKVSMIVGLEVIARTSVMGFKKKDKKASEIARELKVGTLLEGSVRKAGSRIRVTAQLIDANTEGHLWAENYDRELSDIFEVQSSVAEKVAESLRLKLVDKERKQIEGIRERKPEAYDEFLKGVYFARKFDEASNRKANAHFERALELDPNYAEAMGLLGGQYYYMGYVGYDAKEQTYEKGRELVKRALRLNEGIPEAHFSLALFLTYSDYDWAQAEREYRRAIELNPNYAEAHCLYADLLAYMGRTDESTSEVEKALRLDPLSPFTHNFAGLVFYYAGRLSDALAEFQTASQMDSEIGHDGIGIVLLLMGRYEDAVNELQKASEVGQTSSHLGDLGYAYAVSGRKEDALKAIEEIKSRPRGNASRALASIYVGLGENQIAMDWLERAYRERALNPGFNVDPALAGLREEPRFRALAAKMGL
ncbi:MAG TPA: adenylate/guanylate cyclase domain-containing protein [Nitrososphaerales archaeon]|nr:adenylate/guanylate cyclase domain-containing protein [Nitrososphaerales archaeon]